MFNEGTPKASSIEMGVEPIPPTRQKRISRKFILTACAGVLLFVLLCYITRFVVEHRPVFPMKISTARERSLSSSPTTSTTKEAPPVPTQHRQRLSTEAEVKGWERDRSRETTDYINPFEDTTIISGRQICENPKTTVVIICTTRSSDFFKREAIRRSWGSDKFSNVKVGFLLGTAPNAAFQASIEYESDLYQDIIQENLVDSYNNLSLKSVSLLKWYIRWCPMYSVLVKADDDSFIDVKQMLTKLAVFNLEGGVVGYVNKKFVAPRDPKSIYYVPKYIYPDAHFPDYVGGPAYVMSRGTALKLYKAALETPIFHLEDVYITGICARKANVTLRHFPWAAFWEKSAHAEFDKECRSHHVFCHPIREWEMPALWYMRNHPTSPDHPTSAFQKLHSTSHTNHT